MKYSLLRDESRRAKDTLSWLLAFAALIALASFASGETRIELRSYTEYADTTYMVQEPGFQEDSYSQCVLKFFDLPEGAVVSVWSDYGAGAVFPAEKRYILRQEPADYNIYFGLHRDSLISVDQCNEKPNYRVSGRFVEVGSVGCPLEAESDDDTAGVEPLWLNVEIITATATNDYEIPFAVDWTLDYPAPEQEIYNASLQAVAVAVPLTEEQAKARKAASAQRRAAHSAKRAVRIAQKRAALVRAEDKQ